MAVNGPPAKLEDGACNASSSRTADMSDVKIPSSGESSSFSDRQRAQYARLFVLFPICAATARTERLILPETQCKCTARVHGCYISNQPWVRLYVALGRMFPICIASRVIRGGDPSSPCQLIAQFSIVFDGRGARFQPEKLRYK